MPKHNWGNEIMPKVGKKDSTLPKSYRPICLTSFVLKTMEKAVDNYIRTSIMERAPLHHQQHAYRAGRSTETALFELTGILEKAIEDKETAICAFLDIAGAFDNTSHEAIKQALERRGVDKTTTRWACNLLATRTVEAEVGNETIMASTAKGCPQGGSTVSTLVESGG